MSVRGAHEKIDDAVLAWPGVTAQPHRFGGTEYRLGRREIGHIHGDHLVDVPFPRKVRDKIIAAGRADRHHVLPDSGWVSLFLTDSTDVDKAIGLLRESFELAEKQLASRYIPANQQDQKWGEEK